MQERKVLHLGKMNSSLIRPIGEMVLILGRENKGSPCDLTYSQLFLSMALENDGFLIITCIECEINNATWSFKVEFWRWLSGWNWQ